MTNSADQECDALLQREQISVFSALKRARMESSEISRDDLKEQVATQRDAGLKNHCLTTPDVVQHNCVLPTILLTNGLNCQDILRDAKRFCSPVTLNEDNIRNIPYAGFKLEGPTEGILSIGSKPTASKTDNLNACCDNCTRSFMTQTLPALDKISSMLNASQALCGELCRPTSAGIARTFTVENLFLNPTVDPRSPKSPTRSKPQAEENGDKPKVVFRQKSSGTPATEIESGRENVLLKRPFTVGVVGGGSEGEPTVDSSAAQSSGDFDADTVADENGAKDGVPTFHVTGGNGVFIVESHLVTKGWQRITCPACKSFRLKWAENRGQINFKDFREGEQIVNHLPSSNYLTNKLKLLSLLRDLDENRRPGLLRLADIIPESFRLDCEDEYEAFKRRFKEEETWICKPAALNQGKGIFLVRSLTCFEKQIFALAGRSKKWPQHIIQRYVDSPLTVHGRKADIRSYMLIASTAPFLVLFHPGYVRIACSSYDVSSDDMKVHLTNQFMQRKDPRYSMLREETVWSMERLNNYLNKQIATIGHRQWNWVYNTLMNRMRRIMLHCFLAVRPKLESRVGYFELLGFDFLVDKDMKVWLIEINVNPALCTNSRVLRDVIPSVIRETLDISIECFEKNRRGLPLLPLQHLHGYSLLYCAKQNPTWPLSYSTMLMHKRARDAASGVATTLPF